MKFRVQTLIDITKTGGRKYDHPKILNQQANFNTFFNTIGLRTNATEFDINLDNMNIEDVNFGSKYKGKHNVWTAEFYVEAEDSLSVDMMNNDFHLVPIIADLDETIKLDTKMFITCKDNVKCNIIFYRIDK
jgi:hypothetical protein